MLATEQTAFIKNNLGIGKVFTSGVKSTWVVSKLEEVQLIVDIFGKNPLNSTKLLNFLDFRQAFELYTSNKKTLKEFIFECLFLINRKTLLTDY